MTLGRTHTHCSHTRPGPYELRFPSQCHHRSHPCSGTCGSVQRLPPFHNPDGGGGGSTARSVMSCFTSLLPGRQEPSWFCSALYTQPLSQWQVCSRCSTFCSAKMIAVICTIQETTCSVKIQSNLPSAPVLFQGDVSFISSFYSVRVFCPLGQFWPFLHSPQTSHRSPKTSPSTCAVFLYV